MDFAISTSKKNNERNFDKIKSQSPEHAISVQQQNKALQHILDKAKADKIIIDQEKLQKGSSSITK